MNSDEYTAESDSHDEFDIFNTEDDSDMSSDDEFDFTESYMFCHGNIKSFYWLSIHENLDEIPSEALVPKLSMEIKLKECYRHLGMERHQSEPTIEEMEVRSVVETISDEIHYFLRTETSKSRIDELVSHMFIPPDCVESMALKLTDMAKKAQEVGKKMLRVVTEFDILTLVEDDNEEDEEGTLAEALRESMDLADQRRAGAVPASTSSVEALERMTLDKGESDEVRCAICLNDFSTGMEVVRMPCSHVFDGECIFRWLERNHVCPLCRFQMPQQLEGI